METSPGGMGGGLSGTVTFSQPPSYLPSSLKQSSSSLGKTTLGLSKGSVSGRKKNESDKKSFAAAAAKPKYQEQESEVNNLLSSNQKWRTYQIKGQLPLGFNKYIEENFKSCNFFTFMKYKRKTGGDLCGVLKLGFNLNAESGQNDYDKCAKLKTKIGDKEVLLEAESQENLDKNGTFRPRVSKTIILRNLTHELIQNPDLIKKELTKYANFGEKFIIKPIQEGPNLMFKGKAIIKVQEFIGTRPPREVFFPVYYFDPTESKIIPDPDGTKVAIQVAVTGCELEKVAPEPKKEVMLCHGCGKPGHIRRFCPERKFFCRNCEGYDTGCSIEKCVREEQIKNGEFLSRFERTKNIREDRQKAQEERQKRQDEKEKKEAARALLDLEKKKRKNPGKKLSEEDVMRENKAHQALLLCNMFYGLNRGGDLDHYDHYNDPDPTNPNPWTPVGNNKNVNFKRGRYSNSGKTGKTDLTKASQSKSRDNEDSKSHVSLSDDDEEEDSNSDEEEKPTTEEPESYEAMSKRLEEEREEKRKKSEEKYRKIQEAKDKENEEKDTNEMMEENGEKKSGGENNISHVSEDTDF